MRTTSARLLAAGAIAAMLSAPVAEASRLAVYPARVDVPAGDIVRFECETPAGGDVRWEVIPPKLGRVDADGAFRAGRAHGRGIVRVLWSDGPERRIGHAVVLVEAGAGAPPPAILPEAVELLPGEEFAFRLAGGAPDAGASHYRWVVDPPGFGQVTNDGRFRAGPRPGIGRVFAFPAREPGERVHADIRITGEASAVPDEALRIAPRIATLPIGEEVHFTIPDLPSRALVQWSVIPSRLGVIGPDGVFRSDPHLGLSLDAIYRHEGTVTAIVQIGDRIRELSAYVVVAGANDLPAKITIDPPAFRTVLSPFEDFTPQPIRFRVLAETANAATELVAEWRVEPSDIFDVQPRTGERTWLRWVGPQDGNAPAQSLSARVEARVTLPNGRVLVGAAPIEVRVLDERIALAVTPPNVLTTVDEPVVLRPQVTSTAGIPLPLDEIRFEAAVIPADLGAFDVMTGVFRPNRAGPGRIVIRAAVARLPALAAETEVPVLVRQKSGDTGGRR